jgi:hypothetical protein
MSLALTRDLGSTFWESDGAYKINYKNKIKKTLSIHQRKIRYKATLALDKCTGTA